MREKKISWNLIPIFKIFHETKQQLKESPRNTVISKSRKFLRRKKKTSQHFPSLTNFFCTTKMKTSFLHHNTFKFLKILLISIHAYTSFCQRNIASLLTYKAGHKFDSESNETNCKSLSMGFSVSRRCRRMLEPEKREQSSDKDFFLKVTRRCLTLSLQHSTGSVGRSCTPM